MFQILDIHFYRNDFLGLC